MQTISTSYISILKTLQHRPTKLRRLSKSKGFFLGHLAPRHLSFREKSIEEYAERKILIPTVIDNRPECNATTRQVKKGK